MNSSASDPTNQNPTVASPTPDDTVDSDTLPDTGDPRHQKRAELMQQLFAYFFQSDETKTGDVQEYHPIVTSLLGRLEEIDALF